MAQSRLRMAVGGAGLVVVSVFLLVALALFASPNGTQSQADASGIALIREREGLSERVALLEADLAARKAEIDNLRASVGNGIEATRRPPTAIDPTVVPLINVGDENDNDSGGEMAGLEMAVAVAEARIAFVAKEVAFLDSELNDMTEVRESVFTNIYNKNGWGPEDKSGPGSTLRETKEAIKAVKAVIKKYNIKSVLDVPCGSFNWMRTIDWAGMGVQYTGVDIVAPEIAKLQKEFADNDHVNFLQADIVHGASLFLHPDVPAERLVGGWDLVFSRDFTQHLMHGHVRRVLHNWFASGSRYLMTTTYDVRSNKEIKTGGYTKFNLQLEPFNLPAPLEMYRESHNGKILGVWPMKDRSYPSA